MRFRAPPTCEDRHASMDKRLSTRRGHDGWILRGTNLLERSVRKRRPRISRNARTTAADRLPLVSNFFSSPGTINSSTRPVRFRAVRPMRCTMRMGLLT